MTYYVHIITVSYTVISDKITSKATGETITRIKLSLLLIARALLLNEQIIYAVASRKMTVKGAL